jgi:hypothetical protein
MIELIEGLPSNVLGIVVRGRVTQHDCADVLIPALEKAREWHHRLRLYYEIRSRYPGAAWEEISLGLGHGPMWERVAVVSDVAWVKYTVQALRLLIPGEIRVFTTSQTPEGLAWIAETRFPRRRSIAMPIVSAASAGGRAYTPALQFLHQSP